MVSFTEAIQLFFKRYVDFKGRSRRSEFWWVQLAFFLYSLVLNGLIYTVGGMTLDGYGQPNAIGMALSLVALVVGLGTFIPGLALSVRRLHDRNMSGWFLLLGLLAIIPLVGLIVVIGFIVVFALPGTAGPNKFGPDPKGFAGPDTAATFE